MKKPHRLRIEWILFVLSILISQNVVTYGQTITTSNLPLILIDTQGQEINNEPGILCSLKIINNPSGTNTLTDTPNEYNGMAKVEYRGCSSQNYPKKPIGIELRSTTAVTASIDAPLFGFPEESDWVLNPSYIDKTFIRDVLGFYLASATGRYASRYRYVEVFINGDYQGIFVFEEKVKRDAGRVNVTKMDPGDLGSNSITGGYIVKIDKACGNNDPDHQWQSAYASPGGSRNHHWATDYPKDAEITSQQFTYIRDHINSFETMMAGSSCCADYASYIDENAFIDYFLVEELSSNADAYRFSTFLSKERNSKGGKLSTGPVWDFNLAFGFLTSPFGANTESYQGWRYTAPGDPSFPVPFWWGKLLTCPEFSAKFVTRYQQLRQSVWNTNTLTAFIDAQYAVLNQGAFARNFQKWPIIGTPTWGDQPAYNGATLQDEFTHLKTWLGNRLNWMDNSICQLTTPLSASISTNQSTINQGEVAELQLTFSGSSPWSYTLSSGQSGMSASPFASLTVSPAQSTTYTIQRVQNNCGVGIGSGSGAAAIQVIPPPTDLTPIIQARPSVLFGNSTVTVAVHVSNITSVPTSSRITVYVPKQALVSLNLPINATRVGSTEVQNNVWTFDAVSNQTHYVLTTDAVINPFDKLAFGLEGQFTANNTEGQLSISASIVAGSGGETKLTNNSDADKIEYFAQ